MHLVTHPREGWVPTGVIADELGLSAHHLLKVARRLASHGWIEARRGASGGVRLSVSPDDLRVGQIVRRMEPHMALVDCMYEPQRGCTLLPTCALRHKLQEAMEAFLTVLDEVSLSDCLLDPGVLQLRTAPHAPDDPDIR